MVGFDRKSWMELVMFSLVTAVTDEGMGAWYGKHKSSKEAGFMDVLQEVVRPILSVLSVNYIFNVSYQGFHNPMRSFSFMDFLISLGAKDLAVGGQRDSGQERGGCARARGQAGRPTETPTPRGPFRFQFPLIFLRLIPSYLKPEGE